MLLFFVFSCIFISIYPAADKLALDRLPVGGDVVVAVVGVGGVGGGGLLPPLICSHTSIQ